ncbi:MAG: bifunctional phosphoribosylaminoimidazolecarboxamide formyltransferase/IMP cyclohydrolase [Thermovirgaceae bacterium]
MTRKRALISTFDKKGLGPFARALAEMDFEIISSSGTAEFLRQEGIDVTEVSELTGYPHILGGRVKTLHPSIIGGILARRQVPEDLRDVVSFEIPLVDIVVCNLYPFEHVAAGGSDLDVLLENIDIGGVTLIRAAAKNFREVVCIVDPSDYDNIIEEIRSQGDVTLRTKENLALKAFSATCWYDAAIFQGLAKETGASPELLLDKIPAASAKALDLRYGENPHQHAALYLPPLTELPWSQISGKPLSYNNILDVDCALRACALFQSECACVIIKHTTPCGLATGETPLEAYRKALEGDPVSSFGGIIGFSRTITEEAAEAVTETFAEVLVAPEISEKAAEKLRQNRPNLRILQWKGGRVSPYQLTGTWSGLLMQEDRLPPIPEEENSRWVGTPRKDLWNDLLFGWKTAALCKSNAVVVACNGASVGIGSGFTSRIDAVKWALKQAKDKAQGAVLASDAFFPFADSLEEAAKAGISAVIQPGGSIRDKEVFQAAERLGVSMFLTGARTFRH